MATRVATPTGRIGCPLNGAHGHGSSGRRGICAAVSLRRSRPLLLDVGCAKGRWVEELAAQDAVRLELDGKYEAPSSVLQCLRARASMQILALLVA